MKVIPFLILIISFPAHAAFLPPKTVAGHELLD